VAAEPLSRTPRNIVELPGLFEAMSGALDEVELMGRVQA
jgi:hypothetical protein